MVEIADEFYLNHSLELGRDLEYYIEQVGRIREHEDYPIFSDEAATNLAERLHEKRHKEVYVATSPISSTSWRYLSAEIDNSVACEVLFCPPDGIANRELPPTSGEDLLLSAWLSRVAITPEDYNGLLLCRYGDSVAGLQPENILSLLGCTINSNPAQVTMSHLEGRSSVSALASSRYVRQPINYPNLLAYALRETSVKWKFLQTYRVLEQGYLQVVLSQIQANFHSEPTTSLENAKEALSNEIGQLQNLVKNENLVGPFDQIHDAIDALVKDKNRFAAAIEKKAKRNSGKSKAEKAASEIYAIRCAIAHAGTKDIFYEQYEDADKAVATLIPFFEEAVFSFLGIQVH